MKNVIYIAGPIKGVDPEEAKKRFSKAESKLIDTGFVVINPLKYVEHINAGRRRDDLPVLTDEDAESRKEILKHCVSIMALCDNIYMMRGWERSEGATLERNVAHLMGKAVVYEEG